MMEADFYPTRLPSETVVPRRHPVVYGGPSEEEHLLSKKELDDFDRNGFLKIEGVFSQDEIASLKDELPTLERRHRWGERPEFLSSSDASPLSQVELSIM